MSETVKTDAPGKVWQPTMDLRWLYKCGTNIAGSERLQQKWLCLTTGESEWREVPIAVEGEVDS